MLMHVVVPSLKTQKKKKNLPSFSWCLWKHLCCAVLEVYCTYCSPNRVVVRLGSSSVRNRGFPFLEDGQLWLWGLNLGLPEPLWFLTAYTCGKCPILSPSIQCPIHPLAYFFFSLNSYSLSFLCPCGHMTKHQICLEWEEKNNTGQIVSTCPVVQYCLSTCSWAVKGAQAECCGRINSRPPLLVSKLIHITQSDVPFLHLVILCEFRVRLRATRNFLKWILNLV